MTKFTYATNKDKPHLGGNIIEGDPATFCPTVWKYIIDTYGVKSVLDVGSGIGYAAKWFSNQNVNAFALEGLHENVLNAIHPTIEHDITLDKFVKEVDLVNCIEVVEHIDEQFLDNLLSTLCSGKYILISHAVPGQESGWHHVNCQPAEYWIEHFKKRNVMYLEDETHKIRKLAKADKAKHISRHGLFFKNDNR
jgi:SAM-dependent methyltransferase